jgi:sterol desaturase/sphingolipid hydroxylase (fatty acid hydroxylase superfamily)
MNYWDLILNSYKGYAGYLWNEIIHPGWHNYFYWLLLVSGFFLALEWISPWRKNQAKFRKDFWLDFFYMFFNFFLFSLIVFNAASDVVVNVFNDAIQFVTNFDLQASNPMRNWPMWAILLTGFIVRDFIQWNVHRLLHRSDTLWEFHKVHHSVEEMGFAAHLRFHWMENIVYRTIEYIPLALMGIGLYDFFIIHILTLVIGHYNHANITVSGKWTGMILGGAIGVLFAFNFWEINVFTDALIGMQALIIGSFMLIGYFLVGPFMKKIFNSPEMHIWHHAYELPADRKYGINFGISLALWDYIFKTAYIPKTGRDIPLGFPGLKSFPNTFFGQLKQGLSVKKTGNQQRIN